MSFMPIEKLFHVDRLSLVMIILVSFISIIIYRFSSKYMKGDLRYPHFLRNLFSLLFFVILLVISDHLLLFWLAISCSNWVLTTLMVHKSSWQAAKASGRLAKQNFILGCFFIALSFLLLYKQTGHTSIQIIVHQKIPSYQMAFPLLMLLVGAMTQSAIWPFQRWLISSLNSPTPTSAMMHAGIVNGGGFLLARFAPLYFSMPKMLDVIFILGLVTALLGSLWKLMQHDVKRMLACSTMGQMGFMLMQCGLGLFPAAIAHLCWHGLFKAYLFLASGSAAQEKRLDFGYPLRLLCFLVALGLGIFSSYLFARITSINWLAKETTVFLLMMVVVAGTQLALTLLQNAPLKRWPIALLVTAFIGVFYGLNVYFFEFLLAPLKLMQAQPLNVLHGSALVLWVCAWLGLLGIRSLNRLLPDWLCSLYVRMLNSSQPHPATITPYRKGYKYV